MTRGIRISIAVVLCATLWIVAVPAYSMGLGEARVSSFLNQPLEVRVRLLDASEAQLDSLTAQIGDASAYEQLGLMSDVLALGVSVTIDRSQRPAILQVSSQRPVTDPVVQLLIDARWSSGRILREYTLFLDPPTIPVAPPPVRPAAGPVEEPTAVDVVEPAVVQATPVRPAPDALPEPANAQDEVPVVEPQAALEVPADVPADTLSESSSDGPMIDALEPVVDESIDVPDAAEEAAAVEQPIQPIEPSGSEAESTPALVPVAVRSGQPSYTVLPGDTLWSIAFNQRPDTALSMDQTMLAIVEMNPSAFRDGNINQLFSGVALELPDAAQIAAIDRATARTTVALQNRAYAQGLDTPPLP
ncbi:MAG: FimV/HubP family polar landmark protein, partial [Pseudomonadota bacterium]